MKNALRLALVWFALLAIPFQGFAAATMLPCHKAGSHKALLASQAGGHSGDHGSHAGRALESGFKASDEASLSAEAQSADWAQPAFWASADGDGDGGHGGVDKCAQCASCCVGGALPASADRGLPKAPSARELAFGEFEALSRPYLEGPQRPPQAVLL